MSLITDVFSHNKDNGRFIKPTKCKFCNKKYINKLNFHNHQNTCDNHYTEDNFITEEIIYKLKSPKKLSKKSSNKSPKRSPRRIICDDEDENIKKNEIIEDGEIIEDDKNNKDGEIIEDGKIIEDRNNINKRKNNDNIINENIYNKLIPKRKRTETIFIKKHNSNGLEVDPNFTKIKGDKYFKYDNKDIISFDNKKIIINIQNINELTINL